MRKSHQAHHALMMKKAPSLKHMDNSNCDWSKLLANNACHENTALPWQKEASDKSDTSYKRAKCVLTFPLTSMDYHDVLATMYLLAG